MATALLSNGPVGRRFHTNESGAETETPSFSKRCAGLAMRAAILALGLSLGGAGPVLGAGMNDGLMVKTSLSASAAAPSPRWRYGDAWGTGADRMQPQKPDSVDEETLEDSLAEPLVWTEWRSSGRGGDPAIGVGILHPGARPEIMRKSARALELRVYLTY